MTITYHAGRRIQGLDSDRTATGLPSGSVGGWVELGRTTLQEAADNITVSGLSDKRYYMVLTYTPVSGNADHEWQLGNGSVDTGTNYAYRYSDNGGTDSTGTSASILGITNSARAVPRFSYGFIANRSANEKLFMGWGIDQQTAGATTAPNRGEGVGKWDNVAAPLDRINLYNGSSGSFASGSEVVVLGWDPADTHTNNFWEELDSGDLSGGAADSISTNTFTAKKYLWVQLYVETTGGAVSQRLTFNSDATDYAQRVSRDGAADATGTSKVNVDGFNDDLVTSSAGFTNMFISNVSGQEKLAIINCISQEAAGASNAPTRDEGVFKWADTAQITSIQWTNNKAGDMGTNTRYKIWGAD